MCIRADGLKRERENDMKKEFLISTIISSVACVIAVVAIIFALLPDNGEDRKDGVTPTIEISADGYWVINGEKTDVKADGATAVDENPQGLQFCMQDDGTYIVSCGDAKYLSNIVIPETYKGGKVVGIDRNAFYLCTSLTSIIIPDSVTSIGDYAFHNCTSLTSIVIPDSVTSIGMYAFANCTSLTSIVIPDSVTSIGDYAFYKCTSLKNVTIPNSVTTIESGAFSGCSALESMTLPFVGGSAAATSSSSSTLFGYIFGTSSYIGGTSIKQYYNSGTYDYGTYCIPTKLKTVTITGGNILYGAFYNCTSLTNVTIGDSVKSIGRSAFSGCSSLESMTLPFVGGSATATSESSSTLFGHIFGTSSYTGGTSIKQYYSSGTYDYGTYYIPTKLKTVIITGGNILRGAFYNCSSLTSIVIPDSVTSIGEKAFWGCTSLTIYCEAASKPDGWHSNWNYSNRPVVWGYKGE